MTNLEYILKYYQGINKLNADLEKKATDTIKKFGKEINIVAIKAHDLNLDIDDDEVWDAACDDCEYGNVDTRHHGNVECAILGVRYNKETDKIEVLMYDSQLETVDEWMNINYLCRNTQMSVYVTILEYIDQAKKLNS